MEKNIDLTWSQIHQERTSTNEKMTTKQIKQSNDDIHQERGKMFDILSLLAYQL